MTAPPLFQTPDWFEVLEQGLGASSQCLAEGLVATVFRVGPVAAAYLNFPLGIRTEAELHAAMQRGIRQTLRKQGVDLLRYSVPEHLVVPPDGRQPLPETRIQSLSAWSEAGLAGDVRYELRRARREGTRVRPARLDDAQLMFDLYRQTLHRHGGKLRYSLRYFQAMCQLSLVTPAVRGMIAETVERIPCGFVLAARNGNEACYLHAGFDPAYARARPGYVLLYDAITQARDSGSACFNLMASPAGQPELVRFKEKWGGQTQLLLNFDVPVSALGTLTRFGLLVKQRMLGK